MNEIQEFFLKARIAGLEEEVRKLREEDSVGQGEEAHCQSEVPGQRP